MMEINQSQRHSFEQYQEDPRDEYEISLVSNEERSKEIAGRLNQSDKLNITIKNWDRHFSGQREQEYGTIANPSNGNGDISWAETSVTGIHGHPSVNWILAYDGYIEAEDLSCEQRVGLLIGCDVLGALKNLVGKDKTTERITEYFARRIIEKGKKVTCMGLEPSDIDKGSIWRNYAKMLDAHIRTFDYDFLPTGLDLITLDEETNTRRFYIPEFEKEINLVTIDSKKDVDGSSYHSPLSKNEMNTTLNSIATGFLLLSKKEITKSLLGQS